jgi:hypothetical protein
LASKETPPASTELEVSVFGPGIGECVVVHLGEGEWAIVDSCIHPPTKRPIALDYLQELGVDVATAVRLIVATHFHDDHVRGLTDIAEACPNAEFVCSAAMAYDEFWQLLEANKRSGIDENGTSEFENILQLLAARSELRGRVISPGYAKSGTVLYRAGTAPADRVVEALSPSDATMTAAHLRIGALLPQPGGLRIAAPSLSANDLSLALWVRVGDARAVLGADLEETGNAGEGWQAVVASTVRPAGRASIFKIPHHGSPTGHHDPVWTEMLGPEPLATITPYARGVRRLPARADELRICQRTPHVYLTSVALRRPPASRAASVERIVRSIAKERTVVSSNMGHVRLRVKSDGSSVVDLFDAASRVSCKGASIATV